MIRDHDDDDFADDHYDHDNDDRQYDDSDDDEISYDVCMCVAVTIT